MVRYLISVALLAMAGCGSPDKTSAIETPIVTLTETADRSWQVRFEFPEPQTHIVLRQAPEAYREGAWQPLSEGAELKKFGEADVIVLDAPSRSVAFEVSPRTKSVRKAYTPFLQFSDGGFGVLTGQFRFSLVDDREKLEMFEGNGETWPGELEAYTFRLVSERPIFHGGEYIEGALEVTPTSDGDYAYVGDAGIVIGDNFAGLIDSGLPAWIRDELDNDLALIFGELAREWEFDLPRKSEILFVFDGADQNGLSQTGGAIESQLALQVSGKALLEPDESTIDYFRWFLAHESAHLFQIAGGMDGTQSEHAWMHEGGANTMAHRIGARISSDPQGFLNEVYERAFDECVAYLDAGASLRDALKTGNFGAYYSCGDFIGLVTEAALPKGDIFDFWRGLIARLPGPEPQLTADAYLAYARSEGVDETTLDWIKAMVFDPVPDPKSVLSEGLTLAKLTPEFDDSGRLISMELPR